MTPHFNSLLAITIRYEVIVISSSYYSLFHVIALDYIEKNLDMIVFVIDYFEKNLDVIDFIELAFKRGNPICDVTCCCLYSVVPNLFGPRIIFLKKNGHFAMLTSHERH